MHLYKESGSGTMNRKKRICFVVQRYGLEVNGGAELQCRLFAEKLTEYYDVSVFTTKAVDYMSWSNEYHTDFEEIHGVHVHRFPVEHARRKEVFDVLNARFMQGDLHGKRWEDAWFEAQGPYTPRLIEELKKCVNDFDAFVVVTYLYYTAIYSLPILKEKAIFIPEAHNEPFLRLEHVRRAFQCPHAFFFNTEDEHKLVQEHFWTENIPYEIGGVGVDCPVDISAERFRRKYHLEDIPYLIYVGRIDEGKNCVEMFSYWAAYKQRNPGNLKLVLMGKSVIPVPVRDDILNLGFVSDEDKFDGMAGAEILWLPSKFESLSMVVLESLQVKTPVLVNGACEVLKAHCRKSNAGFYYKNYMEFEGETNRLLHDHELYQVMSESGPLYVEKHYNWDKIIRKLVGLIETIG